MQLRIDYSMERKLVVASLLALLAAVAFCCIGLPIIYVTFDFINAYNHLFTNSYSYSSIYTFVYILQFVIAGTLLITRFNLLNQNLR